MYFLRRMKQNSSFLSVVFIILMAVPVIPRDMFATFGEIAVDESLSKRFILQDLMAVTLELTELIVSGLTVVAHKMDSSQDSRQVLYILDPVDVDQFQRRQADFVALVDNPVRRSKKKRPLHLWIDIKDQAVVDASANAWFNMIQRIDTRQSFVKTLVEWTAEKPLYGVRLNCRQCWTESGRYFEFIKEVSEGLKEHGKAVSVVLPVNETLPLSVQDHVEYIVVPIDMHALADPDYNVWNAAEERAGTIALGQENASPKVVISLSTSAHRIIADTDESLPSTLPLSTIVEQLIEAGQADQLEKIKDFNGFRWSPTSETRDIQIMAKRNSNIAGICWTDLTQDYRGFDFAPAGLWLTSKSKVYSSTLFQITLAKQEKKSVGGHEEL